MIKNHSGFIYGQGAACIILKNEKSVKARGANTIAELLAGTIVLDGNHLSDARVSGEVKSMEQAIKRCWH